MLPKVYIAFVADSIHPGHLNIVKKASDLGDVFVGVYTDESIANFSRIPLLRYQDRKKIASSLKGVVEVMPQNSMSYKENLLKIKPKYVVHGDDWVIGSESQFREEVIELLKSWNGKLVEIPYTHGFSSTHYLMNMRKIGTTPQLRMQALRRLIKAKNIIRIMEVHNGISGLIVEEAFIEKNGIRREFDGFWESSLTDSTSKGKPDTSAVDVTSRIDTIDQILEVTTKPMIVDADNGGLIEHFIFTVKRLERLGVSAVVIEDKIGPKRNSLFGKEVIQNQDSKEEFANKISCGKRAQVTQDFMIIARIESLILEKGIQDAISRASAYINAGVDAIMIHSRKEDPSEICDFAKKFHSNKHNVPLVVAPSSYNSITEEELASFGIQIVIYANHMLRSAFPAMKKTAESILLHNRSKEACESCMSIKDIITLIPSG